MSETNLRLLWIVPKWPWPATDGAKVATVNLVRELTRLGVTVDLLALIEVGEDFDEDVLIKELGVRKVLPLYRPERPTTPFKSAFGLLKSLVFNPRTPVTMRYYGASGVIKSALSLIIERNTHKWDFVVYEGPHVAIHAAKRGMYQKITEHPKVIYRAHNREAQIWERKAETTDNFIPKKFIKYQGRLVDRFEKSLVAAADGVAAVSSEDIEQFKSATPDINAMEIPIGYDFDAPLSWSKPIKLLFLGRLDWYPNKDGLLWFLEKVWPKVSKNRTDMTLVVAGSGSTNGLTESLNQPGIDFRGKVPEVKPLYEECSISLVPIFYGGGTRVKAIESSGFGRPCLSTEVGVEGIGLINNKSYIRAENVDEWVEALSNLNLEQIEEIGNNAFKHISEKFNSRNIAVNFLNFLRDS